MTDTIEKTNAGREKLKGLRKAGVAGVAIAALTFTRELAFEVAVIIGIVAVVAILVQGVIDFFRGKGVKDNNAVQ